MSKLGIINARIQQAFKDQDAWLVYELLRQRRELQYNV